MKKIFLTFFSALCIFCFVTDMEVSAVDEAYIKQVYSNADEITVYVSEISDDPNVFISGKKCEAVNEGNVYSNAEKFETYILIDSSKSMQNFSDEIDVFMRELIDSKPDNEYYSVGLFSSDNNPKYIVSDEKNQYNIEKVLDEIEYDFHSTYIYDNLINVIKQLTTDDNIYKRIILVTDGNENSAKGITIDDVTDELENMLIPIYTVTLMTEDKSNLDNLKNISRLARFTGAEDIRITDGTNVSEKTNVLSDGVQDTYCIKITPDVELLDGSVKAMELSDDTHTVVCDVRMAMRQETETVSETTATAVETESIQTEQIVQDTQSKTEKISITIVIAIIAVAVAIICVVVIVILINCEKKKKKSETVEVSSESNDDETVVLSNRSGDTEVLIGDDKLFDVCLVLRDVADSMRTFEVRLTTVGIIIGRSADKADIVIDNDKAISRKHCKIYLKDNKAYIEDLNSNNKTYVNNLEVTTPCQLDNADEIKIGKTRLKVALKS